MSNGLKNATCSIIMLHFCLCIMPFCQVYLIKSWWMLCLIELGLGTDSRYPIKYGHVNCRVPNENVPQMFWYAYSLPGWKWQKWQNPDNLKMTLQSNSGLNSLFITMELCCWKHKREVVVSQALLFTRLVVLNLFSLKTPPGKCQLLIFTHFLTTE